MHLLGDDGKALCGIDAELFTMEIEVPDMATIERYFEYCSSCLENSKNALTANFKGVAEILEGKELEYYDE
jgi:hypothetical protein